MKTLKLTKDEADFLWQVLQSAFEFEIDAEQSHKIQQLMEKL